MLGEACPRYTIRRLLSRNNIVHEAVVNLSIAVLAVLCRLDGRESCATNPERGNDPHQH